MRIDLGETIARVDFPPEIWAWLNLVEEIVMVTQEEALEQERAFLAKNPYQHLLRQFISREISSLNAIYLLLRMELVYQAAAHIRLFCENVITLRYILIDRDERSKAFLDYAAIDACLIGRAYLKWESQTANPKHVEAMKLMQAELEKRYLEVRGRYQRKAKRKSREFRNWCDRSLKDQSDACGEEIKKIYEIGYRQLSAYVHGSGWALRRQDAYIRKGYDKTMVMVDFANLTRILLAIWIEWQKILSEELGWTALGRAQNIIDRCNELDDTTEKMVAKVKKQEAGTETGPRSEVVDEKPRCILCNEPAGEGSRSFSLDQKARELLFSAYPGADPETTLSQNVLCAKCLKLSPEERKDLAKKATARELKSLTTKAL